MSEPKIIYPRHMRQKKEQPAPLKRPKKIKRKAAPSLSMLCAIAGSGLVFTFSQPASQAQLPADFPQVDNGYSYAFMFAGYEAPGVTSGYSKAFQNDMTALFARVEAGEL